MNRLARPLAALSLLAALAAPAAASAATPPESGGTKSQFVIFGEQYFEANHAGPTMSRMTGRQAARFERMMSLKKELVPGILSARKSLSFK